MFTSSASIRRNKISLGYKDPNGNPWNKFMSTFQVGDVAKVTIVQLITFRRVRRCCRCGRPDPHLQIANRRIGKPDEVLTVSDIVDTKITAIDEEAHKISCPSALTAPRATPVRERPAKKPHARKLTLWSTKCPPPARPPATSPEIDDDEIDE